MRRSIMMAAAATATLAATPSMAGIFITSATPGSPTYTGPTPTYDFESATPLTGGTISNASSMYRVKPVGSTGNYAAFGPNATTGTLTSNAFAFAKTISFIWGSVDPGNKVEFLDGVGNVLASFTGNDVIAATAGFSAGQDRYNPVVYFTLTGAESVSLRSLRFSSTTDSLEIDNVAVGVPEPATWGMMVVGFAAAGMGLRRRKAAAKVALA